MSDENLEKPAAPEDVILRSAQVAGAVSQATNITDKVNDAYDAIFGTKKGQFVEPGLLTRSARIEKKIQYGIIMLFVTMLNALGIPTHELTALLLKLLSATAAAASFVRHGH